jgi:hypothetical protein
MDRRSTANALCRGFEGSIAPIRRSGEPRLRLGLAPGVSTDRCRIGIVPIPAAPTEDGAPSTVLALFGQVHQQLRGQLDGIEDEALNWIPIPGANSIATIITHLVGSETETLRCVAGIRCERDRDAEFVGPWLMRADVLRLLEEADKLIVELEPRIDSSRLVAEFPLPTCPPQEVRTGLTWLIGTYGHSREHVGQIQITIQLYDIRNLTRE